jgi:hypothetical protein
MSTYTNAAELAGKELKLNDRVLFQINGETHKHFVEDSFLYCGGNFRNGIMFERLNLDRNQFCVSSYGYQPTKYYGWPHSKTSDYAALTRLVIALYAEIERQTGEVVPIPEATPEPQKTDLQRFIEFFAEFGIETEGVKGDPDPGWLLSIENGTSKNVDCDSYSAVNIWFDDNGKFEIFNIR